MIDPVEHAVYRLRNATVQQYPYPHFYVDNVFPWDFYGDLLNALPDSGSYDALGNFQSRQVLNHEVPLIKPFATPYFATQVLRIFADQFPIRFPSGAPGHLSHEFRFIRDSEGYSIGPHTDTPRKLISLLFYLPEAGYDADCGTGIYVPEDHKKSCAGGPHHPFDGFREVFRAPYVPNSCFGFWKTDVSWHAVEKITKKIQRDVLLFNIYEEKP